jgi:hypothetical protein
MTRTPPVSYVLRLESTRGNKTQNFLYLSGACPRRIAGAPPLAMVYQKHLGALYFHLARIASIINPASLVVLLRLAG